MARLKGQTANRVGPLVGLRPAGYTICHGSAGGRSVLCLLRINGDERVPSGRIHLVARRPGVPGEADVDLALMTLHAAGTVPGRWQNGSLLMRNTRERPTVSVHRSPARFAS
jgi:hypothetical protein